MGLTRLRAEQISDIDYKQAVRAITVTDISNLSGGAPNQVDGVNLAVGDRILVTAQDPGSENGIYQVDTLGTGSNGTWIRSIDTNTTGELEAGTIVMVTEGTVYADTQWKLTTNNPIIIGTTPLTFEQNSAYAFGNIVANTTAVLANSVGGTVTFAPGTGIQITGNNTTKTVTIAATGSAAVSEIVNGNSNVSIGSSGSNVTVAVAGTGNVAVFAAANIVTAANLLPSANVTYSLGSTTARWKDLWVANSSIYIGDVTIATVGSALTINGANVLTGNAGANLSTTGNVIGGNILTTGLVSATGNITGNFIIGNGSQLTGLPAGYANSDAAAYFASGTVSTNILTTAAISATGNVTGGNIQTSGLISATGALTGAAITGSSLTVSTGNITAGNLLLSGAIIDSAQLDIQTSAGNANIALAPNGTGIVSISTQLSATGNVSGGNIRTTGVISATGQITGSQFNGSGAGLTAIPNSALANSAITVNGTSIALGSSGTITATATNALTIGTGLGGTSYNGSTGVTITNTGVLSIANGGGITVSASTGAITLGSTATSANTPNAIVARDASGNFSAGVITATSTSARYADLAEMYVADAKYTPGTVVEFGGANEITVSTQSHSTRVAGIVSTNPSYLMNAEQPGDNVVPVALTGRVPCSVVGTIHKGDRLVASNIAGVAQPLDLAQYQPACIIGKALENYNSDNPGIIEVAVGRT